MATPTDIAQWMLNEYRRRGERLDQNYGANQIRMLFGEQHLYRNQNGNWAIKKRVLDAFRKLTPTGVVEPKRPGMAETATSRSSEQSNG